MNANQKSAVKRKRSCTKNDCKTAIKTKKRRSNNEDKESIPKVCESGKISANELHENKDIYAPSTDTNLAMNDFSGPSLKVKFLLDCKSEKNQFTKHSNIDSKGENSLFRSKTNKSLGVKENREFNKEKIEENLIKNIPTSDFTPKKGVRFKLDCNSDENQFEKDSNIDCHSKEENLFNSKTIKSIDVKKEGELNKEKIEENLIKNTSKSNFTPKKEVRFKLDCKSSDENQLEKDSNIDCHSKGDNVLFNSKTIEPFEVKKDEELNKEKIEGNLIENTSTSDLTSEKGGDPSNITAEDYLDSEDETHSENEENFFLGDFPPNPIISNKIRDLVNYPVGSNKDIMFLEFEDSPDSEDEIAKPSENKQNNLVKASEVYHNTALVEEIKDLLNPFGINKDLIFSKSESDSEDEIAQLFANEQNDFSFSKFNKTKKPFSITHNKSTPKMGSPVPFRGGMFVIEPYSRIFREKLFHFVEKNTSTKIPPETLHEKFDAVDLMPHYIPENLNFMKCWQNQGHFPGSFPEDHSWCSWISNSSYPNKNVHDCTTAKSDSENINYKDILNNILPEGHPWFSCISNSSCPEEIVHDCTSTKSDSEKINDDVPKNILPVENSPEKGAKSSKKSHSKKRVKRRNHTRKKSTKKKKKSHNSHSSASRITEFINLNKQVPESFSSHLKLKVSIPFFKLSHVPPPSKTHVHNN